MERTSVYKTTANGGDFLGNAVALTLGENSITVGSVGFDRAVKFQFSSGDVEFDALSVNGDDSDCVETPSSSSVSDCGNFDAGSNTNWPYVLVATAADGATSQGPQTYTMNVTSLPADGANFRVYKTTANGGDFLNGVKLPLTLGENSFTLGGVGFDRVVKFQFSSGDIEFNALSLNDEDLDCTVAPSYDYAPVDWVGNESGNEHEGVYYAACGYSAGNGLSTDGITASIVVNGETFAMNHDGCIQNGDGSCSNNNGWYYGIPLQPGTYYDWSVTIETCGEGYSVSGNYETAPEPAVVEFTVDMNGVDQPSADHDPSFSKDFIKLE